jgi:two-component system, OmpR family, phosphate regulon sensor histidine kinase PhoR
VALPPLVEEVRQSCGAMLEQRGGQLRVEDGSSGAVVAGDRAQLHQLLQNLIVNALKYGRPGTDVTVAFEDEGEMLRVSVADRGEGIAAEHLPRLTERFYRVDPGRSRALGGTGLGLAIAKHIVGRHRGGLDIQSVQGEGTAVSVWLPKAEEPAPRG